MDLSVKLNNKYQTAKAVFAEKEDLAFVHDWRKTLGDDANPRRNDAVDFAEVAVHRFEAHSAIEPYARAIEDIGDHIQNNPQCEVACLVLLKCDWFPESKVIGVSHFRRTWKNRIVLDYLAAHPFSVRPPSDDYQYVVRGVGPALLYFLSSIAKLYGCDAIWGEATQISCDFYKNVLYLESVEDLIWAPRENFLKFMDKMDQRETATAAPSAREEIYQVEAENPPFVGSKTAVSNPVRRLAYRFMQLPSRVQREIAEALNLVRGDDASKPTDEQFAAYFGRAAQEGKLSDLWRRVEQQYGDGEPDKNPFLKR
jgi:hypothetical protein